MDRAGWVGKGLELVAGAAAAIAVAFAGMLLAGASLRLAALGRRAGPAARAGRRERVAPGA
jgi:hypothetical protein